MSLINNNFFILLQWQILRMKPVLALYFIIQILLASGIVIGFSYLMPNTNDTTALYLTTGAPTVILLSIGLVFLPQSVAEMKTDGTFNYMLSLPLPRLYFVFAEALIWLFLTIPGIIISLIISSLKFNLEIIYSFKSILVFILIGLTAISIGYTISLWLKPVLAELISQLLIFAILLFSPVNFPSERLPDWLSQFHNFLPLQYMANLIRGSLAPNAFVSHTSDFIIVFLWFLFSFCLCYIALKRRR